MKLEQKRMKGKKVFVLESIHPSLLQSNDTVVVVAGNMEPSTWIYKAWIPTLQHLIWVIQTGFQFVQSIAFYVGDGNVDENEMVEDVKNDHNC